MARTQDHRFADSDVGRILADRVRRPRVLLLADVFLVVAVLALGRLAICSLLIDGFVASAQNVPPFVVDARLAPAQAALAFALPIPLALAALLGTRRPATRTPWGWSQVAGAWLIVAFAEWPLASADFTASILALGAIPAVSIGANLVYLREVAGRPWASPPWTLRRALVIAAIGVLVFGFFALYLIAGALGTAIFFMPHPGTYYGPFAH